MKKVLLIIMMVFIGSCAAVPLIKFNSLKPRLASKLNNITGYSADIIGDIRLRIIPYPKITLEKVNISAPDHQVLNASELALFPSIISLVNGNLEINALEIIGGDLTITNLRQNTQSLSGIHFIRFTNSTINFINQPLLANPLNEFEGTLQIPTSTNNNLKLDARYRASGFNFHLLTTINNLDDNGNSTNTSLKYSSGLFSLSFDGQIKNLYTAPDFDGAAVLTLNQVPLDSNDYWSDLANFMIKDEDLSVKGAAKANRDSIRISDIKISSSSINQGVANFLINFGNDTEISLDASIGLIDLQQFTTKKANDNLTLDNLTRKILESFNIIIPQNLVGDFNLSINKVKYNNDIITDIVINCDMIDEQFFLSHLTAKLPGKTVLEAAGMLDHNLVRPKFAGNINLDVAELSSFSSWLDLKDITDKIDANSLQLKGMFSLIPRNLKFYDVKAILGETMVTGKYTVRHSGEPLLNSRLSLRINELDLNQYNIPQKLDTALYNLYLFDNDKSGKFFLQYTNDFAWLRLVPINFGLELQIEKAKYKNTNFQDLQANLRFSPSNLHVDRIALKNDFMDIEAGGQLVITAITPKIDADITINNLDGVEASKLFPSIKDLKDYQSQYVASFDKNKKASQPSTEYLLSGDFNFFSCHNFIGNLKLNVKNYSAIDLNIQNADIDFDLVEGAINLNKAKGKIFSGDFEIAGNIGNSSLIPSFNFTFSLSNFNPASFLKYFTNLEFMKGYASISGVAASSGKDYPSFFSNLNASIRGLAKKITFEGFDITEIIKVTEESMSKQQQAEILTTYSRNGEALFDEASGNADIKKGIMLLSDITFKNNRVSGGYSAFIDLYNQTINGQGRMSFKPINSQMAINVDMRHIGKISEQTAGLNLENVISFLKTTSIRSSPTTQKVLN